MSNCLIEFNVILIIITTGGGCSFPRLVSLSQLLLNTLANSKLTTSQKERAGERAKGQWLVFGNPNCIARPRKAICTVFLFK